MADIHKKPTDSSRRNFLKVGAGVIAGAAVATVVPISLAGASPVDAQGLQSQLNSATSQVQSLKTELDSTKSQLSSAKQTARAAQSTTTSLQTELATMTGFLSLNVSEQSLVEAIVETIIPSDSSGPGAKEAGAIYFIDRQLASDYGRSGNMFMDGPWIQANTTGAVTVNGLVYPGGTANVRVGAGTRYQYMWNMREFWRIGLAALETYANSAYGGNFESLSAANQLKCLQDLWANKVTQANFSDILPSDFAYELTFLAWSGYLMDPLYGGNRGMVGWTYTGFNGVNMGNFYGEGLTTKQLMVATTPTVLQPASLAQYQMGGSGASTTSTSSTSASSTGSSSSSSTSTSATSSTSSSGSA